MSFTAAAIAAGAMGASNLISSGLNYISQRNTNKKNASIAAMNNDTIINLANTAHQREVEDLKEAGLNPILSAGGNGAATPALQQPEMKAPQIDPYMATETIKALSEAKLNDANAALTTKQESRVDAQNYADIANAKLHEAQTIQIKIDNIYRHNYNKNVIKNLETERDKLLSEANHYQALIENTLVNSAAQKMRNKKIDEQLNAEIEFTREQAKFTRERARGKTKSTSYTSGVNGGFGAFGINDGQSYSETY